jgi:Lrp/AsnC family transcriptional regulator for asnA, asnC and gidA
MNMDSTDEALIAIFQEDGRQSNREVARKLDLSEGTVRKRLKKLQDANAVRFDVVTDAAAMGIEFIAIVRVSVAPRYLKEFLVAAAQTEEFWYLAAVAGRYNVQGLICTPTATEAMKIINDNIEGLKGVNEVEVRPTLRQVKHDFYEIVVPRD